MDLSKLNPNPRNPRKIARDRLVGLQRALLEFGDLGGIVYNRRTEQIVGGTQRVKVLPPESEITIEHRYDPPTRTGTVAEGFIVVDGERFKYREVDWSAERELAANIAANAHGGKFDDEILPGLLIEIRDAGIDPTLTGIGVEKLNAILDEAKSSGDENGPESDPDQDAPDGDWETVEFRLPEGIAEQLRAQIRRFKVRLYPNDDPEDVSDVLPLEAMIQCVAQIPDDQLT